MQSVTFTYLKIMHQKFQPHLLTQYSNLNVKSDKVPPLELKIIKPFLCQKTELNKSGIKHS